MVKNWVIFFPLALLVAACASIHEVEQLPPGNYHIPANYYRAMAPGALPANQKRVPVKVEEIEGVLYITPPLELPAIQRDMVTIKDLKLHSYTLDVDIITIPFKARAAVGDFPPQLNANFSGALYIGRRHDRFEIQALPNQKQNSVKLTGVGYGYGGLIGLGSVTMNPFVTQNQIIYEYDGLVLTSGLAGIYDAKKFNLGIALGTDFLLDQNRHHWLYQGQPWLGFLFGINLN